LASNATGLWGELGLPHLPQLRQRILIPSLEIIIIFIISYIFLMIVRVILNRLQRREILSATAVESIYRLLALFVYGIAAISALYIVTNAKEIFYLFIVIVGVILLSNWAIIADITSYYVMLLQRHLHRGATLIELPRLGIRGTVISTSILHIKMRTPAGRIVYVPNHLFLTEPLIHLVNVQTQLYLQVEIKKPDKAKSMAQVIRDVEKRIREKLSAEHLVPRVRDITVQMVAGSAKQAKLRVVVPLTGAEPRPATVNQVMAAIIDALTEYEPRVQLENAL